MKLDTGNLELDHQ
jgi:hypothetical protein